MKKWAIGDKVRLSEIGKDRYADEPYNPHSATGTIFDTEYDEPEGQCYRVNWSTKHTNCYYVDDLKKAYPMEENE